MVDSVGNIKWSKIIGRDDKFNEEVPNSIKFDTPEVLYDGIIVEDSIAIVLGGNLSRSNIMAFDMNGKLLWNKILEAKSPFSSGFESIMKSASNEIIISSYVFDFFGDFPSQEILLKINKLGEIENIRAYKFPHGGTISTKGIIRSNSSFSIFSHIGGENLEGNLVNGYCLIKSDFNLNLINSNFYYTNSSNYRLRGIREQYSLNDSIHYITHRVRDINLPEDPRIYQIGIITVSYTHLTLPTKA